ncbi:helix-turn-helix transcriptional regulator [Phascolarctobacterium sp.]|uniref:helix-turn-helix domain-containing protein n=1 Tax=Phascolarctobacterium sp. TaxID=2049039 RepID=UPI0030568C19
MFAMRYKKIGARIVYFRMLQGISQEDLADKAGISQSYLSKIEHGAYPKNLPLTTLLLIAVALNIDVCEIIKE